jgi:hypothetical protein
MGESANDGIRVAETLDRMRGMSISRSRIAQDMQVSRSWLNNWNRSLAFVQIFLIRSLNCP